MSSRKSISGAVGKGCAGLFAAALCCVGGALPAFAADADPVPDPVPTVKPDPNPAPDPVLPDKPDPKPEPKPDPKPEPKPKETTPKVTPAPSVNSGSKTTRVKTNHAVSKTKNYVSKRSSGGVIETNSFTGQDELAKTGALAITGGLCALVLVVGGGGTILVRKLRNNTPQSVTSTPGVDSEK